MKQVFFLIYVQLQNLYLEINTNSVIEHTLKENTCFIFCILHINLHIITFSKLNYSLVMAK